MQKSKRIMGKWRHWSQRRSTWPSTLPGMNRNKSCEKKVWKNAPIPSLGYGASYIFSYFFQKPRSLAKVSEHFFTLFSHNFCFDSCQARLKVTCSFVATNDVTFPWSFSTSASSTWKIHWTCGATWGRKVVSLSKANLQNQLTGRLPAFSGLFYKLLYILICSYANELGTIGASGASWQLPHSHADGGIGPRFSSKFGNGVEIPAKKDFIFIIFFRRDFRLLLVYSMAAFLFVVVVVLVRGLTVLSWMARVRSIRRGGFCSDLPRWGFLLTLSIRLRSAVLFYVVFYLCIILSSISRCFFDKIPSYVYVRLNTFFASRRAGSAVLILDFFFDEGHSKTRTNCCYVSSPICLRLHYNVLARFRRGRLGVLVRIDGWWFCLNRRGWFCSYLPWQLLFFYSKDSK